MAKALVDTPGRRLRRVSGVARCTRRDAEVAKAPAHPGASPKLRPSDRPPPVEGDAVETSFESERSLLVSVESQVALLLGVARAHREVGRDVLRVLWSHLVGGKDPVSPRTGR